MGMMFIKERGQLSLLFRFLLLRISFNLFTALIILNVLIINSQSLIDLCLES